MTHDDGDVWRGRSRELALHDVDAVAPLGQGRGRDGGEERDEGNQRGEPHLGGSGQTTEKDMGLVDELEMPGVGRFEKL